MKPVRIVSVRNDGKKFQDECEAVVSEGYVLSSSSSGVHGFEGGVDEFYIATFVLPVSVQGEEKFTSDNSDYTAALFGELRSNAKTVGISNNESFCSVTMESLNAALKAVRHCA